MDFGHEMLIPALTALRPLLPSSQQSLTLYYWTLGPLLVLVQVELNQRGLESLECE